MSDNISLKYLFDQKILNVRQARWLPFLREYDFKIKHIEGKENKVVDALRRNAVTSFVATISSYKTELEEGIKLDTEYQSLKEKVTHNVSENLNTNYIFNEKCLMLYNTDFMYQIYQKLSY